MAQVLVVDRGSLFGGDWPQGFVPCPGADGSAMLDRCLEGARYVERAVAERTPAWKQWIPYCVLRCVRPQPPGHNQLIEAVFRVQRSTGQAEARLHGLWSIGIGGHVEPEDGEPSTMAAATFFRSSLLRELHEELHLQLPDGATPRFVGLLNDDQTPVGKVHAGLVYVLDLPLCLAEAAAAVRIREISKMAGEFGSLAEFRHLWQDRSRFETWSQFLVDAGIAGPIGGASCQELAAERP
ncbi:MAG: hypothetical protein FJ265_14605 [Planctomycetes bacterium]|nr:hypothetical protein [Planctomycetota bacterium]